MSKIDFKSLSAGLVAGVIVGTFSVAAYTASNPITAYEDNRFGFVFNDGPRKNLGDGLSTIVYNNRSYVPVRFLAENMGATVNWDDNSKTISIEIPEKIVEKIVEVEKIIEVPAENSVIYKSLPQAFVDKDIRLDLTLFARNEGEATSNFYISVENKDTEAWQVDLYDTKFLSDETTYDLKGVPLNKIDNNFFNDIQRDKTVDGYVTVNNIPKDVKEGILKITLKKSGIDKREINVEFPIKLN